MTKMDHTMFSNYFPYVSHLLLCEKKKKLQDLKN
jgi:hypothetical protein